MSATWTHADWMNFRTATRLKFDQLQMKIASHPKVQYCLGHMSQEESEVFLRNALYFDFIQDSYSFATKRHARRSAVQRLFAVVASQYLQFHRRPANSNSLTTLPMSEIVSFKFFHRHPEFQSLTQQYLRITEIESPVWIQSPSAADAWMWYRELGLPRTAAQLANSLSGASNNWSARWPHHILASAHGLYPGQARIWISMAKARGACVTVLQPGLVHGFASFIDQVEYEGFLADQYLAWGETSVPLKARKINFGSLYGSRNRQVVPGSQVFLPPIPRNSEPRPISYYWGIRKQEFADHIQDISDFLNGLPKMADNVTLRAKSNDVEVYTAQLRLRKRDAFVFESGDINAGNSPVPRANNWILYPSTALLEMPTTTERFFYPIPEGGAYYPEESATLLQIMRADETVRSKTLDEKLLSHVRRLEPEQAAEKLFQILGDRQCKSRSPI